MSRLIPHTLLVLLFLCLSLSQSWAQRPIISYLDKTSASVNETVTISGAGFDADPNNLVVSFGGVNAEILFASNFLLEVAVPAGATWGPVRVVNLVSGLTGTSTEPFTLSFGGDTFNAGYMESPKAFASSIANMYDLCNCDFNADGKLDVATSHFIPNASGQAVTIYTNTSSISSVSFSNSTITTGRSITNITCGDVNNDGKPDLVVSFFDAARIGVFINQTPDSAAAPVWSSVIEIVVSGKNPRRVEIVDMNQDGLPELILTNDSNSLLSIFTNTTSGGVFSVDTEPLMVTAPGAGTKAGLSVADFDGDGFPEVLVSTLFGSDAYYFYNTSTPSGVSLAPGRTISISGNLVNVAAIDVDHDGYKDLCITEIQNSRLAVLRNLGGDQSTPTFAAPQNFSVSPFPTRITPGDLNGDGMEDLAVGHLDNTYRYSMLINQSTPGTIDFDVSIKVAPAKNRNIGIGDINGDAKPDLILSHIDQITGFIHIVENQNCLVPELSPSETITICAGLDFQLSATESPGTTYRWSLDGSVIQEGDSAFVTISEEGLYSVTALSNGGLCANSSPGLAQLVTTGVLPAPPSIGTPDPVCLGDTLTLVATDITDAQYVWRDPAGVRDTISTSFLAIPNFQAQNAGRYHVEILVDGCQSGEVSAVAQVVNLPFIEITNETGTDNLCDGEEAVLDVIDFDGYTYQWYRNDTLLSGATNTNLTVGENGDFTTQIIDPLGCTFISAPEAIRIFAPPIADFTLPAASCAGEHLVFESTSTIDNRASIEYDWDFGNARSGTGESIIYEYPGSGSFNVTLTVNYADVLNCQDTFVNSIQIVSKPSIEVISSTDTTAICPTADSLSLTATAGFVSYEWNDASVDPTLWVSAAGTYQVIGTTNLGCTDTATTEITLFPLPDLLVEGEPVDGIVRGDTAILTASGGFVYIWDPYETLSDSVGDSLMAFPENSTEYSIYSATIYGCIDSTTYYLEVFPARGDPLPPAFSPNDDGIDDMWVLVNSFAFSDCKLTIINRNGSTIFSVESGYDNDWDGTYLGNPLPEGVYYYIFECPDGDTQSGAITLVR